MSLTVGDNGLSTVKQGSAVSLHASTKEQRLLHGPIHFPTYKVVAYLLLMVIKTGKQGVKTERIVTQARQFTKSDDSHTKSV